MRTQTRLLAVTAAVIALSMALAATAATAHTTPPTRSAATGSASGSNTSNNGLAPTPPMGYNDYYQFFCNPGAGPTEAEMVAQANALVSSGLAAKGYKYVNIDCGWKASTRDADGNLQANPVTFPHGIKWLADYVHSLGLKFGIYSGAGTADCVSGGPGSFGHYQQDADTFASWGVDFLKFDWCGMPPNVNEQQLETEMSNDLRATGRPIVFSYAYGPQSWSPSVSNMAYIGVNYSSYADVLTNFKVDLGVDPPNPTGVAQDPSAPEDTAGPGYWNDPDLLLVGNNNYNFTVTQQQSQMSMWSEMAAPLLISNDLTKMSPEALRILGNKAVIAVDQDPLGKQGHLVAQQGAVDIVAKPLAGGDVALLMVNTGATSAAVGSVQAKAIGIDPADTGAVALKNLWTGQTTETAGTIAASLPPYGSVMYRVSPGSPQSGAPSSLVNIQAPQAMTAGQPATVTVSYTDNGRLPAQNVSLDLQSPASGWTIQAASPSSFDAVPPGGTVSTKFAVTPAAGGSLNRVSLTATAKYQWPSSTTSNTATEAGSASVGIIPSGGVQSLPSLASAFNSVGITDDSHPAGGDLFDGDWSFSAQALAAAGYTPGATVQAGGLSFQWPNAAPGTPDNVTGGPLKGIAVSGSGTTLGMLAVNTAFAGSDGLVVYTDGTADPYSVTVPNWGTNADTAGDPDVSTAVAQPYRNFSGGQNNTTVYIDLIKIPVNPNKQVAAVILPNDQFFHLFSVAVGTPSS